MSGGARLALAGGLAAISQSWLAFVQFSGHFSKWRMNALDSRGANDRLEYGTLAYRGVAQVSVGFGKLTTHG